VGVSILGAGGSTGGSGYAVGGAYAWCRLGADTYSRHWGGCLVYKSCGVWSVDVECCDTHIQQTSLKNAFKNALFKGPNTRLQTIRDS
jgi:hypothetical protein